MEDVHQELVEYIWVDIHGFINRIDFVTFASIGNATDFGDLTHKAYTRCAAGLQMKQEVFMFGGRGTIRGNKC